MVQNLDRLKVFYYVYSQKSVAGASEVLNVTQSAVSQSLQKLEKDLRTALFIRLHKKLIPTAAAERLFRVVDSFMSDMEVFTKELDHGRESPFGELRIGAPPEFGKAYLSQILAEFRSSYKDVTFSITFGSPEKLLPMLKEGRIDFVLLDEFLTNQSYKEGHDLFLFEAVVEEEVILACSKKYYEKQIAGDCSFELLLQQDYIAYKNDMQIVRKWFENHFSRHRVKLNKVLSVDNHEAVASSILHDMGLGVVSSHLAREELESGSMIKIRTDKADIINKISLVQLMDKIPTLTERVFSEFLIRTFQTMLSSFNSAVN
jgi:DNA-binding transcriptional LysR family regulator